jgi:opacity protein-like surface antigen
VPVFKTKKYINNLNVNYLFDRRNQLAFAHGIKSVTDSFNSLELDSITQFLGIEYRHDINTKWDVGLQAATMFTDASDSSTYSYGLSAGHSFAKNIWLSLGFNFSGFNDDDFTAAEYTADGAYMKFRVKFDQNTVRDMLAWWEK